MYPWIECAGHPELLYVLFFGVALIYSSVGFGGGSSYLALLSLYGVPYLEMRAFALLCNITVVAGNTVSFHLRNLLDWQRFLPFLIVGIPLSFLGGFWRVDKDVYYLILGTALLFAALAMMWKPAANVHFKRKHPSLLFNSALGGGMGFLSGVVGIGGGVFLSPVLHLMGWGTARKIAALSSVFILFNAITGLLGQSFHPDFRIPLHPTIGLVTAVLTGSYLGRKLSFQYFSPLVIKRITGFIIGVVAFKILWTL